MLPNFHPKLEFDRIELVVHVPGDDRNSPAFGRLNG